MDNLSRALVEHCTGTSSLEGSLARGSESTRTDMGSARGGTAVRSNQAASPRSLTHRSWNRGTLVSSLLRLKSEKRVPQFRPQESPVTERAVLMAANPKDRRAYPRRDSGCQITVCRSSAQSGMTPQQIDWALHAGELKGRLVDVSMSGLALELPAPLEPDSRAFLRISNRNLDRQIDVCGRILRCTEDGDGQWSIVCRLERNLTFEQLHYLGKHLFASTIV